MSETTKVQCNRDDVCMFLRERIEEGGKGFRLIQTVDLESKVGNVKAELAGVSYHRNAKDRGMLLNCCPWCGGKPGYYLHEKTEKARTDLPLALAEIERLGKALRKYGKHESTCAVVYEREYECNCGLDEARAEVTPSRLKAVELMQRSQLQEKV